MGEVGASFHALIHLHTVTQEPGTFLLVMQPFPTRPPRSCGRESGGSHVGRLHLPGLAGLPVTSPCVLLAGARSCPNLSAAN